VGSYNSTPTYVFTSWCLVKHRYTVTFTLLKEGRNLKETNKISEHRLRWIVPTVAESLQSLHLVAFSASIYKPLTAFRIKFSLHISLVPEKSSVIQFHGRGIAGYWIALKWRTLIVIIVIAIVIIIIIIYYRSFISIGNSSLETLVNTTTHASIFRF